MPWHEWAGSWKKIQGMACFRRIFPDRGTSRSTWWSSALEQQNSQPDQLPRSAHHGIFR
jgi:hypothetical protein